MDKNAFAIRNPFIISERIQPAFSQFTLQYDGVNYPIFVNDTAAEIAMLLTRARYLIQLPVVSSSSTR